MKWLPHMTKIGILQKLCKCMLQLSEVMLLTEMLSENVHLEVLEMAGKKYFTKDIKVSKCAKIRNRYNKAPHLTKDTNGKVTNSQLDITNESQWVSPFPAGDHKAQINRRAQR